MVCLVLEDWFCGNLWQADASRRAPRNVLPFSDIVVGWNSNEQLATGQPAVCDAAESFGFRASPGCLRHRAACLKLYDHRDSNYNSTI